MSNKEFVIKNYMGINGLMVIQPEVFYDSRGYFYESYNQKKFNNFIDEKINFVQDNISVSKKGVLRGMHLQLDPHAQGKLVRVSHGKIFDVAVDLRKGSKTYGKVGYLKLSASNFKQLWIPEGFAHGFLSLSSNTQVCYKTTNFYNKQAEITISWDEFNIPWPKIDNDFLISEKDSRGITLEAFNKLNNFYEKLK